MKTKKKLIQEKQNLKKQVQQLNEERVTMTTKWLEGKQDYDNQLQELKQEAAKNEMKWQVEKQEYETQLQELKQEAAETEMKWQEEKQEYETQLQELKQEATKTEMKWQEEKQRYETQLQELKQEAAKNKMKWQEQKQEYETQLQELKQEAAKTEMKWQEEKQRYETQLQELKQEAAKNKMKWQEEKREYADHLQHMTQAVAAAAGTEIKWQEENQDYEKQLQLNELVATESQGEKQAHEIHVQEMKLARSIDKLQQKEHNFREQDKLKLKVQIFCSQESHLENIIMEKFALLLNKELWRDDLELKLLRQSDISEITSTEILLVLCISVHASNSEIQKALKGIKTTKITAVIMIHLKEPHALPTNPSKYKAKEEIRTNVGGIFDMAFLRDRDGLYECPMNKRNACEIISFIKSFEKMGAAISNN